MTRNVASQVPDEPDTEVEQPTKVEPVATRRPAAGDRSLEASTSGQTSGQTSGLTRSTMVATATDTMHLEEIGRTRAFARITLAFGVFVFAVLPLLGGDTTAKWVFATGLVVIMTIGGWLLWLLRDDEKYSVGRALVFGYACVIGGYAGIYYFGIFSPASTIIPFGLYFFSVGQSVRGTVAIWLTCAALEAGLGLAVMTGLVPDRGLVRAASLGPLDQGVIIALVEVTFFATFMIARATRRSTLYAIEQHDRAVRGVAQREALLKEAREELERALHAGGFGRFTEQVLGSFKLGSILGRGGMGEVYEASHIETREPAAVKVLHSSALADSGAIRRFMREARIAASLRSESVVHVLEVGGLDAPVPFIAMERLRGEDLAEILRKERRLSVGKVLTLVRQVGKGLEAARAAGIVHRDLKPRNLFLSERGEGKPTWKILDFGVSKLAGDHGGTLTREGVIGTPAYMAPEQAANGEVTHRTDLFALGVIGYRAITGRPAFSGDSVPEILYRIVHGMPPRPSDFARVHEHVDLVFAIALAKDPASRFDSAAHLTPAHHTPARGPHPHGQPPPRATQHAPHPWST